MRSTDLRSAGLGLSAAAGMSLRGMWGEVGEDLRMASIQLSRSSLELAFIKYALGEREGRGGDEMCKHTYIKNRGTDRNKCPL